MRRRVNVVTVDVVRGGPPVRFAARQTDQSAVGQFDVEKKQSADGDGEQRPQKAVDDVGARVHLVRDGVVQRLRVVEAVERASDRKSTRVPINLVSVLAPRLFTDA